MHRFTILIAATIGLTFSLPASAMTSCRIHYQMKGWSFIYKEYHGRGTITCKNGQRASVSIVSRSAGLSIGKSEISRGKGRFTAVKNIQETFGTYVLLNSHAGATKSVEGTVMTKGEVSLAQSGRGRGFDLGLTLGAFTIKPR